MIDWASLEALITVWLAALGCGLLAWPAAMRLLPADTDLGYLAAKPLGWLVGAYAGWLAAAAGLAPFAGYGAAVGLTALAALFAVTVRGTAGWPSIRRVLHWEAAFLIALVAGSLIRASTPDIAGLEKFMDFGFVNAALRATTMPPPDPWWAGEPINYYYFGHVAAAWLIKVAGVAPAYGYNLTIGFIFAVAASLAYRLVEGTLRDGGRHVAVASGLFAAALVTLGGNFHSVLYGALRPLVTSTFERGFYYPDSTRFIGFDPPTGDKAFTEMPAYGFAVGDLHAHLLNLPAALLMALVLVRAVQRPWTAAEAGLRPVEIAVLGLLFAVAAMSNSWDAVSYGGLMGLALAARWLGAGGARLAALGPVAAGGVAVVAAALLLAAPFLARFEPIASELRWSDARTPAWQLAVVYGHVAAPCAVLLAGLAGPRRRDPAWVSAAVLAGLAALLVALPEIGYVKDIYGADHRRANTMFKLTFQAQPLAALAAATAVGLMLQARRRGAALVGLTLAVPLAATLWYGAELHGGLVRELASKRFDLDGLAFIDARHPGDRPLLDWLTARPPDEPILLAEADGDSYTHAGRLSALTGVPALLGWRVHEWLWRGDPDAVHARSARIGELYTAADHGRACAALAELGSTHIAVGGVERERFPSLNRAVLEGLGRVVAGAGDSVLIEVDRRRCE